MASCAKTGKGPSQELAAGHTLFIYMCGSNLETKQGLAGKNIDVEAAVVYTVTGELRDNGGISFYFPIDFNEKEINEYVSLGISDPYNSFLST